MTRSNPKLVLLMTLLYAATAPPALCGSAGIHAIFTASDGKVIEVDTRTGTFRTPRSRGALLHDCSDNFQTCLTDHHGFAFAYFRKCNDAVSEGYKRLRFHPRIVSVLHGNLWLVFDAAPKYMFHYDDSKGIVGIYIGPTPSFDFRSVLHDRNFRVASLDAMEYRISGSDAVAACSE